MRRRLNKTEVSYTPERFATAVGGTQGHSENHHSSVEMMRDTPVVMRTTLELDDDLVVAAKRVARERGITVGELISELAWQSLRSTISEKVRNGVPLFPPKRDRSKANMQTVNSLRDGE
jgi:hypothetical protein